MPREASPTPNAENSLACKLERGGQHTPLDASTHLLKSYGVALKPRLGAVALLRVRCCGMRFPATLSLAWVD